MTALIFIKDLVVATFSQIASLFAGVFIFGTIIHLISALTFNSLMKSFGRRGVYAVAWLGTPVHELGHALFCIIFLHKITEISFFKPDPLTGRLGYVSHTWNRANPWAVLGNFFIGIGPVLLGSAALFTLFYFLVPDSHRAWDSITAMVKGVDDGTSVGSYFRVLGDASLTMTGLIFTVPNLLSWQFWMFLYLAICITSNTRLSLADARGALSGLGCAVLPFLMLNLVALLVDSAAEEFFPFTAASLGVVYSIFILALIMVVLGFILVYLVAAVNYRFRYRSLLNPF